MKRSNADIVRELMNTTIVSIEKNEEAVLNILGIVMKYNVSIGTAYAILRLIKQWALSNGFKVEKIDGGIRIKKINEDVEENII
ncbi:MAG: hypothetical protein QW047_08805 [Sulfolobales archaeon]